MNSQFNIMGMDVVIDPYLDNLPRMTVSPKFAELMPDEFVAGLNSWMREFFGTESRVLMFGNRMAMGPKALAAIKESL